MDITISPIIQASELLKLYATENIVIVDASSGKDAKSNYGSKHLKGALFVDLNTDLAEVNKDPSIGGRHPLPKIEDFAKTLSNIGISKTSHVVIYDDQNGSSAAARFWWMLRSIGHKKVQVLNGGIQEAEKINFPMSSKTEIINNTEMYEFNDWKLPMADLDEVEKVSQMENHTVIDVRDADRYNGKTEPIDLIAGHIPGAINIPFSENLKKNGQFLSPSELKIKYENIFKNAKSESIIVHCGSGVTACHTLLAIAHAGLEIPKLYVGSWSEWSRNDKPIATLIGKK
ncbi:sulfurtransferase [Gelidibacter pelagius]|uniref:Sulfurtransferase n=1 Tax=Gelidibacter pelagius TaxID=2819985 RepID=A0ABS3SRR2_9FLAO|nr:sulfurtransferase [Gelidibacter pelagius]MBO3098405.1 sulfurtransferase [Gelidibacter pelagius]